MEQDAVAPVVALDALARRAAEALAAPVGLVSRLDARGQSFPGAFGLAEPWRTERWTPLSHSFCRHVVDSGDALVVTNAHDDPRVRDNPAIAELGVIAYVGAPVRDATGTVVGALCAIDHAPRRWSEEQVAVLARLAVTAAVDVPVRA